MFILVDLVCVPDSFKKIKSFPSDVAPLISGKIKYLGPQPDTSYKVTGPIDMPLTMCLKKEHEHYFKIICNICGQIIILKGK